jgi:hypothetical protein
VRTGRQKQGGVTYSPDDGDYQGFLALLRAWVAEAGLPVRDGDVAKFAQHWAAASQVNLRTRNGWLAVLRDWIAGGAVF